METLLQVTASWVLPALFFWFVRSLGAMTIVEFLQRYTRSRQRGLEDAIQVVKCGEAEGVKLQGRQ